MSELNSVMSEKSAILTATAPNLNASNVFCNTIPIHETLYNDHINSNNNGKDANFSFNDASVQECSASMACSSRTSVHEEMEEHDSNLRVINNTHSANDFLTYSNGDVITRRKRSTRKKKISSGVGRGRPRKALVAMYQSQISGDKNTIKIRIKKSNLTPQVELSPNKKKTGRRKRRKGRSDTDISDYEHSSEKRLRFESSCTKGEQNSTGADGYQVYNESQTQSVWAEQIPESILYRIFQFVCAQDGDLPNLVRFCRVSQLWRKVALSASLWRKMDLNYVKERFRTDYHLHWLIYNRLTLCDDLNLSEWKVRDVNAAIESICLNCQELRGLNLSGWKGLHADALRTLTTECKTLERLDLSSVNNTYSTNAQPLVALGQTMGPRLTHLVLAHNKMGGFAQIINSLATHCPNLQLLDISNISTVAHHGALLHIEKLQVGCPKLKVLRLTNSQIGLAPASLTDQVASLGFPLLEELSLAGLKDDSTTTSQSLDDDGIQRILKSSTKLRLLDVRGCIRLSDSGLVKVPAWDLVHLFLSGCYVTRAPSSGLELIIQKWSHSLVEVDLAWSTATESLDAAVKALAEKGAESKLRSLNLCGSSVSWDAVKEVLSNCQYLHSINLQSCRGLPRGVKRLYSGRAVDELKNSLSDRTKSDDQLGATESEPEQSPAHVISNNVSID